MLANSFRRRFRRPCAGSELGYIAVNRKPARTDMASRNLLALGLDGISMVRSVMPSWGQLIGCIPEAANRNWPGPEDLGPAHANRDRRWGSLRLMYA